MKYCKNCSAVLNDNDVFCPECGTSVDLNDAPQANPNAQNNYDAQNNYNAQNEYNGQTNYNAPNQAPTQNQGYNGGYQQPQNYGQQYNNYNQAPAKNPGQTWLICSIISLVCCGGLFAIPSLIFAIQSNQSFNRGDYVDAQNKANTSKILFFVAIGIAVVVYIIAFAAGVFSEYASY